jgi:hypothetical protein
MVRAMAGLLCITMLSACAPVPVAEVVARQWDDRQTEVFRRAYIVARRADGKSDAQITNEIMQIDIEWHIDLVLSDGDLMASTVPNQLETLDCGRYRNNPPKEADCRQLKADQRERLRQAQIRLLR